MAYRVKRKDRSPGAAVRRIAGAQIDGALAVLARDPVPDAAGLHELRKTVKRLRGLIRLVRPVFDGFAHEDACLRDAGRAVSSLRDRDVALHLLDRLATRLAVPDPDREALRAALSASLAPVAGDAAGALESHRAALVEVRARLADWRIPGKGFGALAPGVAQGVDSAAKALRRWRKSGSDEDLHRLRKRIKTHWYHVTLLQPIWPAMMLPRAAVADRLGEGLGAARDLRLIAGRLDQVAGAAAPQAAALATRARKDAARHLRQADPEARRLLAEPGRAVALRWRGWWDLWQD